MGALRWDLFCRVVDNHGDAGVCWRLAAQLGTRGDCVRLVIDDASALAWMAPRGAPGVSLHAWTDPRLADDLGDVVVEAFGCNPPPAFVEAMASQVRAPVWVNLEYLSAEAWVERAHTLPSPQANGLTKWFFFPGFGPRTGGLLREDGLLEARAAFDGVARAGWLARLGVEPRPGERLVSLFSYPNPRMPELLAALAAAPTLLLLAPGAARVQAAHPPAPVRTHALPWLDQHGYDRLLWSCALNFVRGEDSLVRAIWAGAPFAWMAYPQHDGAHHAKVDALLARLAPPPEVAMFMRAWNGCGPWAGLPDAAAAAALDPAPDAAQEAPAEAHLETPLEAATPVRPSCPARAQGPGPWAAAVLRWRRELAAQADLATQLRRFVQAKCAGGSCGAGAAAPAAAKTEGEPGARC
jgi:uncharacterized repeat protein (TIGR03837 family)